MVASELLLQVLKTFNVSFNWLAISWETRELSMHTSTLIYSYSTLEWAISWITYCSDTFIGLFRDSGGELTNCTLADYHF